MKVKKELILHLKGSNKEIRFPFQYFHGLLKCGSGTMICSTTPWECSSEVVSDPLSDILSQLIACMADSGRPEKVGMV